jgi:hypothetical protein
MAQSHSQALSGAQRAAGVEGVAQLVERDYVFADAGARMAAAVRAQAARGAYDAVDDGEELAHLLTRELRAAGNDLHLNVSYSAAPLPPEPEARGAPGPEELERWKRRLARDNYGFRRVEILAGNIGYIRLDTFAPPEFAADAYIAAMALVANSDALIIDLRENGGSMSPDAIPLLCSYFFEQPTHLIDLAWSGEPRPRQLWTLGYVPGRRYLHKPIYVLTSRRTFSGAEEFAYDLQNLKRATVVGETTGGGANPGGVRRASDHFAVFVPFGRVTSPVTQSNWEGVGVAPDIAAPAGKALLTAQVEAARALRETADEGQRAELARAEADAAASLARFKVVAFELAGHEGAADVGVAGTFNAWSPRSTPLARRDGRWVAEVDVEPGRHLYKFVVDGRWVRDPANPETDHAGEGANSVRTVAYAAERRTHNS